MRALFILLIFFSETAFSQTQFIFTRYAQDDGLASNKIQFITEDNRGFIWLASEEGLTRFDNYSFKTYANDLSDPSSLPDNSIQRIVFNSSGEMIVKTESGLSRYDVRNDNFIRVFSFADTADALLLQEIGRAHV